MSNRRLVVDQIAIGIVLNHITSSIPPVVKNLTTQDVPADTPHALVPLGRQPLMAKLLRVEVVHLERTVVDVRFLSLAQEDCVVIDVVSASVNVSKDGDVFLCAVPGVNIEQVAWHKVERVGVPAQLCGEVLHAKAVMTQLLHKTLVS